MFKPKYRIVETTFGVGLTLYQGQRRYWGLWDKVGSAGTLQDAKDAIRRSVSTTRVIPFDPCEELLTNPNLVRSGAVAMNTLEPFCNGDKIMINGKEYYAMERETIEEWEKTLGEFVTTQGWSGEGSKDENA
jgi:hypothetical protein